MIILSGPSGSGKTTLYSKLLIDPRLKNRLIKSVSVTTRPQRPGEINGRDYIFVSQKKFIYKKHANHFLEFQKVFTNYYGTPKKNVADVLRKGKNVLLCIDVKGARVVLKKFPKAVTIFVKTPSLASLKKRLLRRGSEIKQVINLRLKTASEELKEAKNYKHIVINDDLNKAFQKLRSIVLREINF